MRLAVRHRCSFALALVLAWCAALPEAQAPAPARSAARDSAFAALPTDLQQRLQAIGVSQHARTTAPGMSVAVRSGTMMWSAGFGLADVENEVPVGGDTVFRIASISKPVAATAVMQLVERGRVSLDEAIQTYVPAFPLKGEQKVSVRHLLTHTSGVRHYMAGEFNHREPYETIDSALAIFKDDPLLFSPGTRYSYSTYGYNLLAGVVERASGLTFESYLQQHIFAPAGMRRTFLEHPDRIVPKRARQYVRGPGGRPLNAPYADLSIKWAGGGIIATAPDLLRFDAALAGDALLKAATREQMYQPMVLADGSPSTYGLGWMVSQEQGVRWIAHSGGATGGTTYLLRRPECGIGVAVLTNVQDAPGLRDVAMAFASALPPCDAGRSAGGP